MNKCWTKFVSKYQTSLRRRPDCALMFLLLVSMVSYFYRNSKCAACFTKNKSGLTLQIEDVITQEGARRPTHRNGNPYLSSSIPFAASSSTSCSLALKQVQPAGWNSCQCGTKSADPVQRFTKTVDAIARPSCTTSAIYFFLVAQLHCIFTDAVCAGTTPLLDKAARCHCLFTFMPEADWQWSEGERMR